MLIPKVTNMESPKTGNPVANQFIIEVDGGEVFQSYSTPIASKSGATITISSNWNYSNTTNKYFGEWLRSFGLEYYIQDVRKWLKKAEYGEEDIEINDRFTFKYVKELN